MPFRSAGGTGGGGGGGTVTSIAVAADNGTGGSITGAGTISILGGNNTDTNVVGTTVTINANWVTRSVTTTYTALAADRVLLCDASGGSFVLTLPTAVDGKVYIIKDKGTASATQTITVSPSTGNIDGASTFALDSINTSLTVVGDGVDYWII